MKQRTEIIVALDVDSRQKAIAWVKQLYPQIKIFKVGLQLYTACGPKIVEEIHKTKAEVFLDLKFNDIPHTMVCATKELLKQKVLMFTVHALSGPVALKEIAMVCKGSRTKALAVTILTSIDAHFLKDLKIQRSLQQEVLYLANMAKRCGLDGVVCSAQEAKIIRARLGRDFLIVTPGIRPQGVAERDQSRIATPEDAKNAGVNYIVIGRPILEANNPIEMVKAMQADIGD